MVTLLQNFVIRWKLVYVYTIFLVLLSILPINSPELSINHVFVVSIRLDYLLHCVVYIPLVIFIWLDKGLSVFRNPYKTLRWVIVLLLFAIVTEWVQYILPYRAFNINDLIANSLGVLIGVFFMMLISFRPVRVIK